MAQGCYAAIVVLLYRDSFSFFKLLTSSYHPYSPLGSRCHRGWRCRWLSWCLSSVVWCPNLLLSGGGARPQLASALSRRELEARVRLIVTQHKYFSQASDGP